MILMKTCRIQEMLVLHARSCLLTVHVISIVSLHQVFLSRSPKSREAATDVLNCLNLPTQDIGFYFSSLSNIWWNESLWLWKAIFSNGKNSGKCCFRLLPQIQNRMLKGAISWQRQFSTMTLRKYWNFKPDTRSK